MFKVEIKPYFTKEVSTPIPIRTRSSNKEKTDLTPIDNPLPVIGKSKAIHSLGYNTSIPLGSLIGLNGMFHVEQKVLHTFGGVYTFEKLNKTIEKGIRRDLIALKNLKCRYARVIITLRGQIVYDNQSFITDTLSNKIKYSILKTIVL